MDSGATARSTSASATVLAAIDIRLRVIRTDSLAEAIEWAKRVPFGRPPFDEGDSEIEIRQFFELEDFGPGEGTDRHAALREQVANA